MATTALGVVSLAEIKTELRRPSGDTSLDGLLQDQIGTAVSYVSQRTHLPLVDRQERFDVPLPVSDNPLLLPPFVRTVDSVVYWTPSRELRQDSDGMIATADLGRVEAQVDDLGTLVYPPAAGWPAIVQAGSGLRVVATRGFDVRDESRALRAAVILGVRDLFGGYREIRQDGAMERILGPWIYYGTRRKGGVPVSTTPTPPPTPTHTLYALVTPDSATPSAADFLAAASTTANDIEVPAHGQGYLHFADTRSSLSDIKEQGSAFSSRAFFSDTPTPLQINGVQHYVYTSKGALFAHGSPQVWELTS